MKKSPVHRLKRTTHQSLSKNRTLPSDASIASISALLIKSAQQKQREQKYAAVKDILSILGAGATISALVLVPKRARVLKPLLQQSPDWDSWKHFNPSYLRRTFKRLEEQKDVEITQENGQNVIRLTKNGKRKILRLCITKISIDKPKHWDKKWRLVLYDVPTRDKTLGDMIRQALRTLGFYAIQDSAYIYPYSCFEQIEFLREYYHLGDNVQYMVVEHIERDNALKTYFDLS